MKTYIINLPKSKERLTWTINNLTKLGFDFEVIEAVNGRLLTLPHADYDERAYRLRHGKRTNLAELGCYFSHIKALKTFLQSEQDHAMILEDDVTLFNNLPAIIEQTMLVSHKWDILRLVGFHSGIPVKFNQLTERCHLCCNLGRQTGAGIYIINRKAAQNMVKYLLPMRVPYDHAFDREWCFDSRTMFVTPSPTSQYGDFESTIMATHSYKLPTPFRIPVFFYRAYNEISRVFYRTKQIITLKLG